MSQVKRGLKGFLLEPYRVISGMLGAALFAYFNHGGMLDFFTLFFIIICLNVAWFDYFEKKKTEMLAKPKRKKKTNSKERK